MALTSLQFTTTGMIELNTKQLKISLIIIIIIAVTRRA